MSEYVVHRKITLQEHHRPTGNTRHFHGTLTDDGELLRGEPLPAPHSLMIVQLPPADGYYLLYLDSDGEEVTDTYHDSLEKAFEQAQWEFLVEPDEWETP